MRNIPGELVEQNKMWVPPIAEITSIVAGIVDLFIACLVSSIAEVVGMLRVFPRMRALGLLIIVIGVAVFIGGIFTLPREVWGVVLAGAICSLNWSLSLRGLLCQPYSSPYPSENSNRRQ